MRQRESAIQELCAMSEADLQSRIIEPLLRNLGFRNVRVTAGPRERGKDLIATKSDPLAGTQLYAIQIKKYRPTGSVGRGSSFGRLLDQLRQALQEPVLDTDSNLSRVPDICVFVTPHPIPVDVRESFQRRLDEPIFRSLRIVDGIQLLDLIGEHLPQAIDEFSMEVQYRLYAAREANVISESSAAFDLRDNLHLDDIYVDADLDQGRGLIARIALSRAVPKGRLGLLSATTRGKVCQMCRLWRVAEPTSNQDVFDLGRLLSTVATRVKDYYRELRTLALPTTPGRECTRIATSGIRIAADTETLTNCLRSIHADHLSLLPAWASIVGSGSSPSSRTSNISIPTSVLLKIQCPVFVAGAPGGGKTTLLRKLQKALALARHPGAKLPLLVPLNTVNGSSAEDIFSACIGILAAGKYSSDDGLPLSIQSFRGHLAQGRFFFLLDGLDETGSNAGSTLETIKGLASQHPECRWILTSRDTFGTINWKCAFPLRLRPFSDEQLRLFVSKWFASQPTTRDEIRDWLEKNEKMREAAKTPLIAALLCSLRQAGTALPEREFELYEGRLQLFLSKWDFAKGLSPLPAALRDRYLAFLMDLAFQMHEAEQRTTSSEFAADVASRYYLAKYHREPHLFVRDCVSRGLLELEETGGITFGHLTYQEYMAARWLSYQNDTEFILRRLLSPWWMVTIDFYAALRNDIAPIIEELLTRPGNAMTMERIMQLSKFAPLTPDKLLLDLRRLSRTGRTAANRE